MPPILVREAAPRDHSRQATFLAIGLAALTVAGPWAGGELGRPQSANVDSAARTVFTVTLALDAPDAQPGDGVCATADGGCAIRAAIQEANARPAAGPYAVVLPTGEYTLTMPGDSEDAAVGGDVDIRTSLELRGAGSDRTIIYGPNEPLDHAFEVFPPAVVTFRSLTIRDSAGGGIKNRRGQVAVVDSTIRNNRASFGGGIANDGDMTITFSSIVSNTGGQGGGIVHFGDGRLTMYRTIVQGNGNAQGGGLKVHGALDIAECAIVDNLAGHGGGLNLVGAEPKIIRDTTIAHNHAGGHPEPEWHGYGGGIWNQADDVRLINVTLSDNWGQGGGIFNVGRITMTNSTLAFNGTHSWGAAINNVGPFWLANSVIGPSPQGGSCDLSRVRLTSGGHNLDRDGTCMLFEPTDLRSVDPLVGPLADNGGSTWTHALLPGSPAIDAGDDAFAPPLDQRGGRRPAGAASDIGAFEYGATPGAPTPVTSPTATRPTPTRTPTDAGPTPTATVTPPVGADVVVTGIVIDASSFVPIAGATVAIDVCLPRQPFQGTTAADGRYRVVLPASYADACTAVAIEARAVGYITHREPVLVAELRAMPARNFALVSTGTVVPGTASATPTTTGTPTVPTPAPRAYLPLVQRFP